MDIWGDGQTEKSQRGKELPPRGARKGGNNSKVAEYVTIWHGEIQAWFLRGWKKPQSNGLLGHARLKRKCDLRRWDDRGIQSESRGVVFQG